MKFILQYLKNGISRLFSWQKALSQAYIFRVKTKRQEFDDYYNDQIEDFNHSNAKNILYVNPIIRFMTTKQQQLDIQNTTNAFQSRGLLDLLNANTLIPQTEDKGDFSSMNPENFVHVLNIPNIEFQLPNFRLDEVQTTISQMVDNLTIISQCGELVRSKNDKDNSMISPDTILSIEDNISIQEIVKQNLVNHSQKIIFRPML